MFLMKGVAPRAGAWIETFEASEDNLTFESHPARVRGLKLFLHLFRARRIESHPARVRGLKLDGLDIYRKKLKSHPARVRGLKHGIERGLYRRVMSHPARVRGLKLALFLCLGAFVGRTPRGCVD